MGDSQQILTDMEKIIFTTLLLASSSQAGHYYPSSHGGYASARQSRQAGNIVEELTNNAAFAALPADLVAAVTSDVELLKKVLLYHVVPGTITSDQASNDITLKTVEGTTLRVNVYSKPRPRPVVEADITATNGVVHAIDTVI